MSKEPEMNKKPKPNKASTHSYGIGILCFFVGLAGTILSIFAIVQGNVGVLSLFLLTAGVADLILTVLYMYHVSGWLPLDEKGRREKKKGLDRERIILTAVALVVAFASIFVI